MMKQVCLLSAVALGVTGCSGPTVSSPNKTKIAAKKTTVTIYVEGMNIKLKIL